MKLANCTGKFVEAMYYFSMTGRKQPKGLAHVYSPQIRELFWEYLEWANTKVNEEFDVNFDIATMLEADMDDLDKFMPPRGRLLLGYAKDRLTGIACLKEPTSGAILYEDESPRDLEL